MVFTSTLFQTYVKNSDWLYMKQWQLPLFSAIGFPLKCTFFSLISFLISLYITSITLFIFSIFFIAAVLHNFMQLFTHKMFHQQLCVSSEAVSLILLHNIQHILHKNGTVYLYRMKESAKPTVDNKQSCLFWKPGSCLNSHRWLRRVLPRPWK